MGNFSTGKSTLLNRFLEKSVLPTGITPETSLATELHYSANERIEAFSKPMPFWNIWKGACILSFLQA
ncbi:hypothetical protein NP0156_09220 [Helicobacter pylori]